MESREPKGRKSTPRARPQPQGRGCGGSSAARPHPEGLPDHPGPPQAGVTAASFQQQNPALGPAPHSWKEPGERTCDPRRVPSPAPAGHLQIPPAARAATPEAGPADGWGPGAWGPSPPAPHCPHAARTHRRALPRPPAPGPRLREGSMQNQHRLPQRGGPSPPPRPPLGSTGQHSATSFKCSERPLLAGTAQTPGFPDHVLGT